jgi:hypothetical protein
VLADLASGLLDRLPIEIAPAESIVVLLPAGPAASGMVAAFLAAMRTEAAGQRGASGPGITAGDGKPADKSIYGTRGDFYSFALQRKETPDVETP